jgi:predicted enzyme related to lactoylglutathione lyase
VGEEHRPPSSLASDSGEMFERLHHVQLAMWRGGEDAARAFYGELLQLAEIPKPPSLADRGGVWFAQGGLELHLGVEDDFRPARKAHPGLLVTDVGELARRLSAAGESVTPQADLPGLLRFHAHDPFGNRLEFLQRVDQP